MEGGEIKKSQSACSIFMRAKSFNLIKGGSNER